MRLSTYDKPRVIPTGEVNFAKLGRKSVLQEVKEIFANQPGRPKLVIDHAPAAPVVPTAVARGPDGIEKAAASLLEAGVKFIESITSDGTAGGGLEQILFGLFAGRPDEPPGPVHTPARVRDPGTSGNSDLGLGSVLGRSGLTLYNGSLAAATLFTK